VALSLYFYPSFKRSLKTLGHNQRSIAFTILEALEAYYTSNCNLTEAQKIAPRFFYKQLKRPFCEAGIEKNIRVIIEHKKENRILVLSGNHDQIKQFLASNR